MGKLLRPDGSKISDVTDVQFEDDWVDMGLAGDVFAVNAAAEIVFEAEDGSRSRVLGETCLTYGYSEAEGTPRARLRAKLEPLT